MITSVNNEKIKEYAKLKQKKYRDRSGFFIIEGFHLVEEAKKNHLIVEILTTDSKINGTLVSENVFKKISNQISPQNILAICKKPFVKPLGNKVVLLNNLQDPGNIGNIIRSAKAFGFSDVVVEGVDIYNSKTISASQGAIFQVNCFNIDSSIDFINKNSHYNIVGTLLDKNAQTMENINKEQKMIFIFGNEGQGIDQEIIKRLNQKVYIPIDFESLNVAATAAIILHYFKED